MIAEHAGGSLWLAKTVPTDRGWGVFWLRGDPDAPTLARVYYAHVNFEGGVDVGPLLLQVNIPRVGTRGRYYNVAWSGDHYGFLVADRTTLYYYNLSFEGVLSGRRTVGPPLFATSGYDPEADSDFDAFPGGFVGVIEGECSGHSCSYAFLLTSNGDYLNAVRNLVDYDFTHQFWPRVVFDGTGFTVVSVKDAVSVGGLMSKYIPGNWTSPSTHLKVVPGKDYLWDDYPELAWNGRHHAALWTEVNQRPASGPPQFWQTHFATFRRNMTSSVAIGDRVLDQRTNKSPYRWTKQVHPVGGGWTVHYSAWDPQGQPLAFFEYLDDSGTTLARLQPFSLTTDALGSSVQTSGPHAGRLGIARGDVADGLGTVSFFNLDPPVCQTD